MKIYSFPESILEHPPHPDCNMNKNNTPYRRSFFTVLKIFSCKLCYKNSVQLPLTLQPSHQGLLHFIANGKDIFTFSNPQRSMRSSMSMKSQKVYLLLCLCQYLQPFLPGNCSGFCDIIYSQIMNKLFSHARESYTLWLSSLSQEVTTLYVCVFPQQGQILTTETEYKDSSTTEVACLGKVLSLSQISLNIFLFLDMTVGAVVLSPRCTRKSSREIF